MQITGRVLIEDSMRLRPTSRGALNRWIKLIERSVFYSPQDVKNLFGVNVDFVGKLTVFDVGGNKVRIIAKLSFKAQTVAVTHVLTHEDYDRNKWRE